MLGYQPSPLEATAVLQVLPIAGGGSGGCTVDIVAVKQQDGWGSHMAGPPLAAISSVLFSPMVNLYLQKTSVDVLCEGIPPSNSFLLYFQQA